MEKLRWRDDLFEVVETARDEHKQLYQQLSAIHADLQVSVQDDECATSGHHRVIGQFQALELKFEMFVKKYNDPSTSRRGLRFADEWRERVNLKTDLMALKTSIGLTNFGTAVKSRTKEVTDTSSAMVTRARAATKEATDNSVAKVKEATDNSVAKMKEATDTSVSKVHDVLHDGKAGVAMSTRSDDEAS
ncbi:hypothetical protein PHYBOEH_010705 [Phytophthora boehmeriae]|uniref:Uncharacterized protein n=1 Tax=Phytophthora boehmeriae TaxID=109152 RepID=A0A8T1WYX8_9STRA|nr:hypothetical protein PHYBOEH_010705 [Phytophthora boehmeriae]